MSEKLTPYDDYIETNLDWINHVPSHWAEQTMRSFTKLSSQRNNDREDLELLSVYREYGVIRKSSRDDNHNVESQDLSNYKFVDKGYLVLNKMKMWQGSLGVSKYTGIVSPAYIVCKLIGDVNYNYIHYLLRSPCYKTIYNRLSYGVRVGQWDMRYDDFKNIKLFLPPLLEQDQIAKYLDSKLAKIARFIRAKKKLIEVLKEQKQAIINEAVTKGLDPNAKMKPSGVAWLGDIPDGWEVRRLKILSEIKRGASPRPIDNPKYFDKNGEYAWVRITDVTNSSKFLEKTAQKLSALGASLSVKLEVGELFISICASVGKPCIAKIKCCIHDGFVSLKGINPDWIDFIYLIFMGGLPYKRLGNVGTQLNLNSEIIGNIYIPYPPREEQQEIVTYIETKTKTIDATIATTQKEIDLITEYRTRLISDVVTGKVDVRGVVVEDDTEDLEIEAEEIETAENEVMEGDE